MVPGIRQQHNGGIKDVNVGQFAQPSIAFLASQGTNRHTEHFGKIPKDG